MNSVGRRILSVSEFGCLLAISDVYRHAPWHAHLFFPSLPRWMSARQCAVMVMIQHMSWAGEDLRRRGHQSHVLGKRGGRQAFDLWIILQCQRRGVPICALLSFPLQRWQMHHRKWKYWELPRHLSGTILDGVGGLGRLCVKRWKIPSYE